MKKFSRERSVTLTEILMYKFKYQETGLLEGLDHEEKIIFSSICEEAEKIEASLQPKGNLYILAWLRHVFSLRTTGDNERYFPVAEAVKYLYNNIDFLNNLNFLTNIDTEAEFYSLCARDFVKGEILARKVTKIS